MKKDKNYCESCQCESSFLIDTISGDKLIRLCQSCNLGYYAMTFLQEKQALLDIITQLSSENQKLNQAWLKFLKEANDHQDQLQQKRDQEEIETLANLIQGGDKDDLRKTKKKRKR